MIVRSPSSAISTTTTQLRRVTTLSRRPSLTARSTTGTTLPRRLMTPRMLGGTYGLGFSATQYANLTAPFAVASVFSGIAVGVLVRRTGPRLMMYLGLSLFVLGALFLAFAHDSREPGYWLSRIRK